MWTRVFDRRLQRELTRGTLNLTFPDGATRTYGDGSGRPVGVTLRDWAFPIRYVLNPDLTVGEAYMNGTLKIDGDDLEGFFEFALKNRAHERSTRSVKRTSALRTILARLRQYNPAARSKANVAHHYDLSEKLYDLFLDEDRQYSCAYFKTPEDTLEQAQAQKKKHIAGKLLIKPGMRVLDIGCGWGGMALTLARDYGADVVGVTLSEEQLKYARARVKAAGLEDRVDIRLQDYRALTESFDRIVSVGMFEHVGVPHFLEYFAQVRKLLKPDGVALIHTIGRTTPPGGTSAWIQKYIFPGGYCPSLSEVMKAVEMERLYPNDIEIWRLHYAETLKHWYARFMANIDAAQALYDERFCRMWRYYLLACEKTFRHDHQCVFQFQLAHDADVVPVTRDYLYAPDERAQDMIRAAE